MTMLTKHIAQTSPVQVQSSHQTITVAKAVVPVKSVTSTRRPLQLNDHQHILAPPSHHYALAAAPILFSSVGIEICFGTTVS